MHRACLARSIDGVHECRLQVLFFRQYCGSRKSPYTESFSRIADISTGRTIWQVIIVRCFVIFVVDSADTTIFT